MAMTKECRTQVGVFATRREAEEAIADLRAAGYKESQIGLVARNAEGNVVRTDASGGTRAEEGALAGAVAGASVGGLVGLGVAAGVIPVVGPVLAVGTLGTILLNAAGGAALAGIAGALIGLGIPEEDARFYEDEVKAGKHLVTVECGYGQDARDIVTRHGGYDRAMAFNMGM
jgi:hypothetical protein